MIVLKLIQYKWCNFVFKFKYSKCAFKRFAQAMKHAWLLIDKISFRGREGETACFPGCKETQTGGRGEKSG